MPLTRPQAESILVGRRRNTLTFLKLSTAIDGTNPVVAYPLGRAVRQLGGTTADPTTITDADLATVPQSVGDDRLLDVADIELLEWILGNWDQFTFSLQEDSQQRSDLLDATQKTIARLRATYAERYPVEVITTATVAAGGGVRAGRICPAPWAGRIGRGWPR